MDAGVTVLGQHSDATGNRQRGMTLKFSQDSLLKSLFKHVPTNEHRFLCSSTNGPTHQRTWPSFIARAVSIDPNSHSMSPASASRVEHMPTRAHPLGLIPETVAVRVPHFTLKAEGSSNTDLSCYFDPIPFLFPGTPRRCRMKMQEYRWG